MIDSIPGAGDILGDPHALPEHRGGTKPQPGVSPDAFDPPAASGIGPNPNHPMDEPSEAESDTVRQEAQRLVERAGGIERAIELIRSLDDNR
ncbi:MAG TPA: hypothetical protein VHV77_07105 [Pirellulales bacterium]|nr:hypothetical protein [Pirellulales bacterium]